MEYAIRTSGEISDEACAGGQEERKPRTLSETEMEERTAELLASWPVASPRLHDGHLANKDGDTVTSSVQEGQSRLVMSEETWAWELVRED